MSSLTSSWSYTCQVEAMPVASSGVHLCEPPCSTRTTSHFHFHVCFQSSRLLCILLHVCLTVSYVCMCVCFTFACLFHVINHVWVSVVCIARVCLVRFGSAYTHHLITQGWVLGVPPTSPVCIPSGLQVHPGL